MSDQPQSTRAVDRPPRRSRRSFLRGASLALLGAAALPLASACQSPQPAAPAKPAEPKAAEPKPAEAKPGAGGQATGEGQAAAVGAGSKALSVWSGYPEMKPY